MKFKKGDLAFLQFDSNGLTAYVPVKIKEVHAAALHRVHKIEFEDSKTSNMPESMLYSIDDLKNIKFEQ